VDALEVLGKRGGIGRVHLVDHVDRLRGAGLRSQAKALGHPVDQLETREVVEETMAVADVDVVADLASGDDRAFRLARRLHVELVEAERGTDASERRQRTPQAEAHRGPLELFGLAFAYIIVRAPGQEPSVSI